jgi:hypothetical protein
MPTYTHVVEFDEAELVCRIVEAFSPGLRPEEMSASEAVDALPDEMRDRFLRVAHVAMQYFRETFENAKRVQ